MNKVEINFWKEFQISKLFLIKSPAARSIKTYGPGTVPYVSSGGINNGIVSYLEPKDNEVLEKGNCITVSPLEGTPCFYQKDDFLGRGGAGSAISLLYNENLTEYVALFICEVIRKSAKKFNYADAFTSDNLKKFFIKLPAKRCSNGEFYFDEKKEYSDEGFVPDWNYMEQYMRKIKPIAESKINNFNEVKGNQTTINVIGWKRFNLYDDDLFDIKPGNKFDRSKMQCTEPSINFIGRSGVNNGISCEVDLVPDVKPYSSGCLTIALGGSIGACFIQEKEFYTSQNVIVLVPKWKMSNNIKFFIASLILKESRTYYKTFEDELNRHMTTDFSIMLPIDGKGKPDWNYMEEYVEYIKNKSQSRIDLFNIA